MVVTGNPLLAVPYRLPQLSQRIVKLMIAHIDDERDEELPHLIFSKKEVVDALGLENYTNQNDALRSAFRQLRSKGITLPGEEYDDETGWIHKARVWKYKDRIDVWFDDALAPYLLDLKNEFLKHGQTFTKHVLEDSLKFRGDYTMKLFDICTQWRFKSNKSKSGNWFVPHIPMPELRYQFGVDDENGNPIVHKEWREFRRKAIEPSMNEVNEKCDFEVDWVAQTRGRKVTAVRFECKPKDKKSEQQAMADRSDVAEGMEGVLSASLKDAKGPEQHYKPRGKK